MRPRAGQSMTKDTAAQPAELPITQVGFDPLGPQVHEHALASGRTVHYIDEGEPGWTTVLFLGGAGTTVRAFGLLEFVRSLRLQLQIRVVSVERNGLGKTQFDPAVGLAEHAADVWALLDRLDTGPISIVTISGGGPYAAQIAAARPHAVRSLHVACSVALPLAGDADDATVHTMVEGIAADPVAWWRFPEHSAVHRVPGFADSVIEEATRGVFARGRDITPEGLMQALQIYRNLQLPDLGSVRAPAFLYWGAEDAVVPLEHRDRWAAALPTVVANRVYPGEGHDVQYRHWDQILTDVTFLGERIIVCAENRTVLATPARASELIARGATLGLCAWRIDTGHSAPRVDPQECVLDYPSTRPGGWGADSLPVPAPLELYKATVPAAWVDYNGHMSEWCFLLAMGNSSDAFFRYVGIDEAYRASGGSLFTAETHIRHLRELTEGEELTLGIRVLGVDTKRVHLTHQIQTADGELAATGEQMLLHVDMTAGRVAPLPVTLRDRLQQIAAAHAVLPRPDWVGHVMEIPATRNSAGSRSKGEAWTSD